MPLVTPPTKCDKCGLSEYDDNPYNNNSIHIGNANFDTNYSNGESEYDLCSRCITLVELYINKKPTKKDEKEYEEWEEKQPKYEPNYAD